MIRKFFWNQFFFSYRKQKWLYQRFKKNVVVFGKYKNDNALCWAVIPFFNDTTIGPFTYDGRFHSKWWQADCAFLEANAPVSNYRIVFIICLFECKSKLSSSLAIAISCPSVLASPSIPVSLFSLPPINSCLAHQKLSPSFASIDLQVDASKVDHKCIYLSTRTSNEFDVKRWFIHRNWML